MNEQHKYRATDKMSDLICDNYSLLMVMSRFGLSLGFGDKSVKDVCEAQNVDYRTFLAVANFISEEQYSYSADDDSFSIPALMDYLKRAHAYFLDFNLPAMRRKLIEAIDCSRDNDVAYLILKFFDEYAKEVRRHMEYENEAVFTYVEQLLQGRLSGGVAAQQGVVICQVQPQGDDDGAAAQQCQQPDRRLRHLGE